jgi:hypothetical protein
MCVCVGFVTYGCFGNMCICIYCVFVLFLSCIFILFMPLFNFVSYVFLLLCMFCSVYYVFIVPTGTLRLPWLRFLRPFSSVVRQMSGYNSQRRGTARTLPKLIVLFCVLFVCKCVLYYCHQMSTQLQLTNISISIYIYTIHRSLSSIQAIRTTIQDGRLRNHGSVPSHLGGNRFFFTPRRPDRLWDPTGLLFNAYRMPFSHGQSDRSWS